jgi:hypothetical protein
MNSSSAFRTTALLLCIALPVQQAIAIVPARCQAQAPSTPTTLAGKVPAQIAQAHTVFLTPSAFDPNFPIDSARAYNAVYADIQSRGLFQLADSPAHADLVLQLRGLAPVNSFTDIDGNIYSTTNPAFQLTVVDPATNLAIWTITAPVSLAGRRRTYDHWISLSETNLVSRLQVLSGHPLTSTESADLTTVPRNHNRRNALLLVGAVLAVGAAGGLILHHEYENGLANGKAQQDAFCKAKNIPLSECAGG